MSLKHILIIVPLILVTSCSSTDLITSALKPDTGITAQAGLDNVKQGVGVTSKVDTSKEVKTEQRDVSGNAKIDNTSQEKGSVSVKDANEVSVITPKNSQSTGSITAEKVNVNNGVSVWPLIAFSVAVLVLVLIFSYKLIQRLTARSRATSEND